MCFAQRMVRSGLRAPASANVPDIEPRRDLARRGLERGPLPQVVSVRVLRSAVGLYHLIDDRREFTAAYCQKLDRIGVAAISKRFQEISEAHGGRDLVLLCWEDIRKPGEWCHRQVFAEWWLRETGEAIVELETGAEPSVSSPGTLQLPFC